MDGTQQCWLAGRVSHSVLVSFQFQCSSREGVLRLRGVRPNKTDCIVKAGDELADKLIGVVVFVVKEERRD